MERAPADGGFVGRTHEVEQLRRRLRELSETGRGRLVLVGGEPGIGKTALLNHVLESLGHFRQVTSHCLEEGAPPYGPWREALSVWTAGEAEANAGRRQRLQPSAMVGRVFEAVARSAPSVLVIEDLQWADDASLEVLRLAAARLAQVPLLVFATYRPDELHHEHPLWRLLPEMQRWGADRLLLPRLPFHDVQALVNGWVPDPDLARRAGPVIFRRCQGVPLFAKELARQVAQEGMPDPAGLPDTLRQAIDSRLARLSPPARQILEPAAVLGEQTELPLLAAVAERDPEELADLLSTAALKPVLALTADGRHVRFEHNLVREAVLAGMPPGRRARWHQRAADMLAALPPERPDAVAYHLSAAGDPRAPAALLLAGTLAFREGAVSQAADRWRAAEAGCPADAAILPEILLKRGVAARWTDPDEADRLFAEAARRAGEAGQTAVVVWSRHELALSAQRRNRPVTAGMAELLDEERGLLENADYRRLEADLFGDCTAWPRILVPYSVALAIDGRLEDAERLLDAVPADELAPGGPDLDYARLTLSFLGGRYADMLTWAPRASERARRSGDWRAAALFKSHELLFTLLVVPNHHAVVDRVVADLKTLEQEAERRAGRAVVDAPYTTSGIAQYMLGEWNEAQVNLVACAFHERDRAPDAVLVLATDLLLEEGDWRRAGQVASYLAPRLPEDPAPFGTAQAVAHGMKARVALAGGDQAGAEAWLAGGRRQPTADKAMMRADLGTVEALLQEARGRSAEAAALAREARLAAGEVPLWWYMVQAGRVEVRCLAASGEVDEARRLVAELIRTCRVARYRGLEALLQAERAVWEDDAEARAAAAREGARLFREAGAELLAARVEGRADGAEAGGAGVTAREREIARMVAEGLTDRDIAAQLNISPRTVDRHLRNLFQKLGIANRAALAAYAVRRRWL